MKKIVLFICAMSVVSAGAVMAVQSRSATDMAGAVLNQPQLPVVNGELKVSVTGAPTGSYYTLSATNPQIEGSLLTAKSQNCEGENNRAICTITFQRNAVNSDDISRKAADSSLKYQVHYQHRQGAIVATSYLTVTWKTLPDADPAGQNATFKLVEAAHVWSSGWGYKINKVDLGGENSNNKTVGINFGPT